MSQNCACPCPDNLMLPVTGFGLGINAGPVKELIKDFVTREELENAIKVFVSREEIVRMIAEAKCECSPADGFEQSLTEEGWVKLPNGLIMQWGFNNDSPGGEGRITFPIPFPNKVLSISLGEVSAAEHRNISFFSVKYENMTSEGFSYLACDNDYTPRRDGGYWMAIGY